MPNGINILARKALQELAQSTLGADLGLWETAQAAQLLNSLAAVDQKCASVCPGGRIAVTGGADGTARLWDLVLGRETRSMHAHNGPINAIAISADGHVAVSAGEDGLLKVWDLNTGAERQTFRGSTGAVRAVDLLDDGRQAISGGDDGILRIWDVQSGRQIRQFTDHVRNRILSLCTSQDGGMAVTGTYDSIVSVWDLKNARLLEDYRRPGPGNPISCVAISSDKSMVLAGETGSAILTKWIRQDRSHVRMGGHTNDVSSIQIFSDEGKDVGFVSAGTDGRILVHIYGQANVRSFGDQADRLSFACFIYDNSFLAGGHELRVWLVPDSARFEIVSGDNQWIYGVSISPDGRMAASGGDARVGMPVQGETSVRIWDTATGKPLGILRGHQGPVWSTAFSPDGALLLSGSEDRTLKLWDAASGRLLQTLAGHAGPVHSVAFVGSGEDLRAVSASDDGTIRLWGIAAGKELATFRGNGAPLHSMAVDGTGNHIVAGTLDGTVFLWPVNGGGSPSWSRTRPGAKTLATAFAPDGKHVVSGYSDGVVELTETAGGNVTRSFHAHAGAVFSVGFLPEGNAFITGGEDRGLKVWNSVDGREMHRFHGQTNSLAVSADGSLLLSGGGGRALEFRHLDYPALCRSFDRRLATARTALQGNPEDGASLSVLGQWYALHGMNESAIELLERARRGGADIPSLTLARSYLNTENERSAVSEFKKALGRKEAPSAYLQACIAAADPVNPEFIRTRAAHRLKAGEFREVAADYAQVQKARPDDHWIWFVRGCLLAYLPDEETYRAHCDAMLKRFGQTQDPDIAERVLKTVLLLPQDSEGRASSALLKQLEPALHVLESSQMSLWRLQVRGRLNYRAGRYSEAIDLLTRSVAHVDMGKINEVWGSATSRLYLALALHAAGGRDLDANATLKQAIEILDTRKPRVGRDLGENFQDWLICLIALREARQSFDFPMPYLWPSTSPATVPATRPAAATSQPR